jgi:hypothetical protein
MGSGCHRLEIREAPTGLILIMLINVIRVSIFSIVVGYFWSFSSFWGILWRPEVRKTLYALDLDWLKVRTGRTLEETAALFDGEQPQQDLARLGGDAAILNMSLGRGAISLSRRTDKSTDYYPDIVLELRPSYASQSMSESHVDSGKQSQESAIIATWNMLLVIQMYFMWH